MGARPMPDSYGRGQSNNRSKNGSRFNSVRYSPNYSPPMANQGPQRNVDRAQSSHVDLNDPIQVHLLTESALFDSRRFEILSQEEVDDLKKQCQSLSQRIEKTRSNLAIQTKYRDAAVSMAKLYSPAPGRQTPGSRSDNRASADEAELERQTTERKCEELAAELSNLETGLMGPQRRLLEHTAGILQLTHKASKRKQLQPPSGLPTMNGVPGSPESLYTFSNDLSSIDGSDDPYLDYQDPAARMRPLDPVEIPPKSPVRGQTVKLQEEREQLRRENDRLRQETAELRAQTDAFGLEVDALRREGSDRGRDVSDLEWKLQSLNSSLRDVIVMFNPTKNANFQMPPATANDSSTSARGMGVLETQLDYLRSGISTVKREQGDQNSRSHSLVSNGDALEGSAAAQAQGRIDELSKQMTDLLLSINATPPPPPNPAQVGTTDLSLDDRISYLQHSLRVVEVELVQAVQAANSAVAMPLGNMGGGDAESKLRELWDIIQNGLVELQRQREDRQRIRNEKGLADEEDMTIDQTFDLGEKYSAIELQSRVKTVASQLSKLTEQKCVLKRQIKQQRELNNKSSGEKDIELSNKDAEIERRITDAHNKEVELQGKIAQLEAKEAEIAELSAAQSGGGNNEESEARIKELEAELAETKQYLEQSREDGAQTQGMLVSALRDLDTANRDAETRESEGLKSARAELEEKRAKLADAESSSKDLESRLNMTEASRAELQTRMDEIDGKIETLEVELLEARAALKAAEESSEYKQRELEGRQREVKEKDDVLESLNMMIAELKTELTITQAELEGAYGSRAERAADLAAIKSSDEVTGLKNQVETYKNELEQTLKQLEEVTRETLSAEREKLDVETKLDDVTASKELLEEEIKELRERVESESSKAAEKLEKLQEELDTARLKGGSGEGGKTGAGAAMLSEQFRATMRGERKKFQEDLRVSFYRFMARVRW